jgi:cytochrome P450
MENNLVETPRAKLPPGPGGNVLLRRRKDFMSDSLKFLQDVIAEYPRIARLKAGTLSFVNITVPDYIEHVLSNRDIYIKINEGGNLRFLLGNGLLTSEGEFWMKQRKLIQPVFHKQRLQGFVQKIADCTAEMMKGWDAGNGGELNMHAEMNKLTLDIVGKTLFSTNVSGEFGKVSSALTMVLEGIRQRRGRFFKWPYWVPLPEHRRMQRHKEILDGTIMDIINKRRNDNGVYDDLLTMLIEVQDADTAERMTDVQIRDEALTIFIAGHETTANAMAFIFYLLAKHPEVKKRVDEEIASVIGNAALSYENLNRLEYTTMVIKEAMRLYPPAWVIVREATRDDIIDGYLVKKGDKVIISSYAVQHSSEYWPEPEKFDPKRFAHDKLKSIPRYAYFPFGGGARLCIGNNFAMMEMQIILAMVSSNYNFALPADFKLELKPLITLRPKDGVPMRLERK